MLTIRFKICVFISDANTDSSNLYRFIDIENSKPKSQINTLEPWENSLQILHFARKKTWKGVYNCSKFQIILSL